MKAKYGVGMSLKRKFGGHFYHYTGFFTIKSSAEREKGLMRAQGYQVRIDPETSRTTPTRYHVWVRMPWSQVAGVRVGGRKR